jgi:hypothetical protein
MEGNDTCQARTSAECTFKAFKGTPLLIFAYNTALYTSLPRLHADAGSRIVSAFPSSMASGLSQQQQIWLMRITDILLTSDPAKPALLQFRPSFGTLKYSVLHITETRRVRSTHLPCAISQIRLLMKTSKVHSWASPVVALRWLYH